MNVATFDTLGYRINADSVWYWRFFRTTLVDSTILTGAGTRTGYYITGRRAFDGTNYGEYNVHITWKVQGKYFTKPESYTVFPDSVTGVGRIQTNQDKTNYQLATGQVIARADSVTGVGRIQTNQDKNNYTLTSVERQAITDTTINRLLLTPVTNSYTRNSIGRTLQQTFDHNLLAQSPNFILNGGFEWDSTCSGCNPTAWVIGWVTSRAYISNSTDRYSGRYSLYFYSSATTNDSVYLESANGFVLPKGDYLIGAMFHNSGTFTYDSLLLINQIDNSRSFALDVPNASGVIQRTWRFRNTSELYCKLRYAVRTTTSNGISNNIDDIFIIPSSDSTVLLNSGQVIARADSVTGVARLTFNMDSTGYQLAPGQVIARADSVTGVGRIQTNQDKTNYQMATGQVIARADSVTGVGRIQTNQDKTNYQLATGQVVARADSVTGAGRLSTNLDKSSYVLSSQGEANLWTHNATGENSGWAKIIKDFAKVLTGGTNYRQIYYRPTATAAPDSLRIYDGGTLIGRQRYWYGSGGKLDSVQTFSYGN